MSKELKDKPTETVVLQPRVNLPVDELGQGKIVSTTHNQASGFMNTPETYEDYK